MATLLPLMDMIRRRRWLMTSLSILLLLVVIIVSARLWIASSGGRAFVEAQIDGRKAGSLGTIQIEGLSGDPLDRFGARRITLADSDGVWLSVENVDLAWSPARLLSRTVKLDLVSAGKVDVRRRPVVDTSTKTTSGTSGNWAVSLDQLKIAELLLQEGVAGPRAGFEIDGQFRLPKTRTFELAVTALPLEGVGDRVNATLKRTASGAYRLDAEVEAPAGGTLATLAKLPDGDGATLTARASGTPDEGDGFAELKISGATAAELTAKITDGTLLASANINATRLPLSDRLKTLVGPSAGLALESDMRNANMPFSMTGNLSSGSLSANGIYRSRARSFEGPVDLDATFSGLDALAGIDATLVFNGTLTDPLGQRVLSGMAKLSANPSANLPFDLIEGPVQVATEGRRVNFEGALAGTGILKSSTAFNRIAGKTPKLDLAGTYNLDTGIVSLAPSTLNLAKGRVAASGQVDTRERILSLEGRLQQVAGLLSSAPGLSATGSVGVTGSFASPVIAASITVQGIEDINPVVADALGRSARLRATVQRSGQTYLVRSARLEGDRLDLALSGTYAPGGTTDIKGQFTQNAALDVSGTQIDLGTGTIGLSGPTGAETVRLTSSAGTLNRDALTITALQTSAEITRQPVGWAGPVALAGLSGDQPVDMTANASWADGVFALRDIRSGYQTASLSGSLVYGGQQGLDMELSVAGDRFSLDSRHIGQFDVTLNVDRPRGEDMAISASGHMQDAWLSPSLRFDSVTGQIRNAPEGYNFSIQVERDHETRPTTLAVLGEADFAADYPSGQIELDGVLLGEQVRSIQPVSWRLGETPSIEANLAIFGGTIEARIAERTRTPRMTLTVADVDLAPVLASAGVATSRVMVNGSGDFLLFGADPEGRFDMNVEGPLPGLERSLAIDAVGRLRNGALVIDGAGDYGALRFANSVTLPVLAEPEGIAHLDMDGQIRGTANLQGDLADLRSLALAYGHDIGGVIDASADLSGTLRTPVFSAQADLSDGVYEFGATSLRLVNLDLDVGFANQALTVTGSGEGAEGGQ
ncbi:MAG: hypothetical protein R3265_11040, partial [Hyphomonas sp.]|nr:hypothetical protein [Hyphomonas sp.]